MLINDDSGAIRDPKTGVVRVGVHQLQLANNVFIHFRVKMKRRMVKLNGMRMQTVYPFYLERVADEDAILIAPAAGPGALNKMPLAVHASITAAAILLKAANDRHLIYEDSPDRQIAPRQIAQRIATQYGVDVNVMMDQYPVARKFMLTRALDLPLTMNAILALIGEKPTVNLRMNLH